MNYRLAIVCVDDEQSILDSLRIELEDVLGDTYALEMAQDGEETLEVIGELQSLGCEVAVVIADCIMPGMRGDELLTKIHERFPKTLKIMLTGQADIQAVGRAINRAALYRYIAKPWEAEDLKLTVREALYRYVQDKEIEEKNIRLQEINQELARVNQEQARLIQSLEKAEAELQKSVEDQFELNRNLEKSLEAQVRLTEAMQCFVPQEFLHFLSKESITELRLGDHVSKEMAVLFSDIREFTSLSETMTPQETFDFINAYLRRISPIVRDRHGLIVKYLGDGTMAVFPGGANDAVSAGIAKLERVRSYNLERVQRGYVPIDVGIGIHLGKMMVGIIGDAGRMQVDALADAINLTARLEGLTKVYGVSLLISEQVLKRLDTQKYPCRFLGRAVVKGRKEDIAIYEVLDGEPEGAKQRKLETLQDFNCGVILYRQAKVAEAKEHFERAIAVYPEDKAAKLYLERTTQLLERGTPDAWDGIWRFAQK